MFLSEGLLATFSKFMIFYRPLSFAKDCSRLAHILTRQHIIFSQFSHRQAQNAGYSNKITRFIITLSHTHNMPFGRALHHVIASIAISWPDTKQIKFVTDRLFQEVLTIVTYHDSGSRCNRKNHESFISYTANLRLSSYVSATAGKQQYATLY